MLASQSFTLPSSEVLAFSEIGFTNIKKKRRPAGTPDPDAEVVSLSPETLMESDHYVCEICNHGFHREQNLQMHRRSHKVPWKLLKRETPDSRKRVYVCPEPTCVHHDPCHALGDLVGIKKHFRRKHSNYKQWFCDKCSKGYAVQSDYKAHLKTCGTKGHSCDCGRVFSRVETFIEHQDTCKGGTMHPKGPKLQASKPASLLQTSFIPGFSSNSSFSKAPPNLKTPNQKNLDSVFPGQNNRSVTSSNRNIELQLLASVNPFPSNINFSVCATSHKNQATQLKLSIGSLNHTHENEVNHPSLNCRAWEAKFKEGIDIEEPHIALSRLKGDALEQLRMAKEENALAQEKRRQAKWEVQLAEQEFTMAKKIRQQALEELSKAQDLRDRTTKEIKSNILRITCHTCKKQFQTLTDEAGHGEGFPVV